MLNEMQTRAKLYDLIGLEDFEALDTSNRAIRGSSRRRMSPSKHGAIELGGSPWIGGRRNMRTPHIGGLMLLCAITAGRVETRVAPVAAVQGGEQTQRLAAYSPWQKFCGKGKDPNARPVCFTGKDGRSGEGKPMVAAALIEPEGGARSSSASPCPARCKCNMAPAWSSTSSRRSPRHSSPAFRTAACPTIRPPRN